MTEMFEGSFTQQEPIPEAGIAAAERVLRSGRLHRYNTAPGETSEAELLEAEFARAIGLDHALAVASGGQAMIIALRAVGVQPGDRVLTNAFTLAPVPGAIAAVGATPVYLGVTEGLALDLDDLAAKADRGSVLLLSHMRGHLCDMDRLMAICAAAGIMVVEDCAHTMGAAWNGRASGTFGAVACFSTQTYKHLNSGEGGFIATDDAALAARAILMSGSYMFHQRHGQAPAVEVFDELTYVTPNQSARMDNLRAAILRPQLANLPRQCARWTERYRAVEAEIAGTPGLQVIDRPAAEDFVGSSIQFLLPGWDAQKIEAVLARCAARGVELKWFGGAQPTGFTSRYDDWRYAQAEPLPDTDRILRGLLDMRLPLTFSLADCALIGRIIRAEVAAVYQQG
ncbi:DegT/DnrJ/EryC1/StrS family aminotransferase [Pseudooceanicola aestuarii]|uniref:DegT/DnrJ/EryC1/StrS family aminotransferase n=1 Tax=Pseudooceanicola aestuarii TaxID=2697319 RepID=UPI0013D1A2E5|nr:DegT/DnrJ/EryC1/StrS family aminotransferase [Pseudooceanicola aestuarii]